MIDSFKALLFTLLGALATAAVTFYWQQPSSGKLPTVSVRNIDIGGYIVVPTREKLRDNESGLKDVLGSGFDRLNELASRGVIFPSIFEISIKNEGEWKSKVIEVSGINPVLSLAALIDQSTSSPSKLVSFNPETPLRVDALNPRQEYRLIVAVDRSLRRTLPIAVIHDGQSLPVRQAYDDPNDFIGVHDFIGKFPFTMMILLIVAVFSVISVLIALIQFVLVTVDVSWARVLYSRQDVERFRRVVAFFDSNRS